MTSATDPSTVVDTDPSVDTTTAVAFGRAVGLGRRQVLGIAAGAGAVSLLAACGGGDSPTAGADDSAGSEDGGASSDAGGGGGAGTALVATADVAVGGGVILDDRKIVVTQPTAGDFKAFSAICTHQSCTVGSVKDNVISCPCHGSAYSAEDGSVENGPAPRPLKSIAVSVEGDQVVEA